MSPKTSNQYISPHPSSQKYIFSKSAAIGVKMYYLACLPVGRDPENITKLKGIYQTIIQELVK